MRSARCGTRSVRGGARILYCIMCLVGSIVFENFSIAEDLPEEKFASWLKAQTDSGQLKIDFYEPGEPPPFPGWTTFEFRLEFQYEPQINWRQKKTRGGPVFITPVFSKIEVPVTHRIELPKHLKSDRWYEAVLARHELEHVRVGSHPRLVMLSKHLIKKLKRIERTVERPEEVTKEWVKKQIEAELTPRKDAIYHLVMETNRNIDKSTNHGATSLEDRDRFFADLYLKDYLDEMKFPYLSELLDLVQSREYLDARVPTQDIDVEPAKENKK